MSYFNLVGTQFGLNFHENFPNEKIWNCSLIHFNYSSARKLIKLEAVQFVLNNHTVR